MNLKKLKDIVDFSTMQSKCKDPEEISVVITLEESSVGCRAYSEICHAGMGFDWESNQFRIQPRKKLVTQGHTFNDPMPIIVKQYNGRNFYKCPKCPNKVTKSDNFCRHCSQKLDNTEFVHIGGLK